MRRNLTMLGVLCLLLWVTLGFVRPWYGPPTHIARADWAGSIEVLTWAPPWNRDAVSYVELYRVAKPGAKLELLAKAEYVNDNHDGRFWLIFNDDQAEGEQFYIQAHLRNGTVAPKLDITRMLSHYDNYQYPYFVMSMPLFLLGAILITWGQSLRRSGPQVRISGRDIRSSGPAGPLMVEPSGLLLDSATESEAQSQTTASITKSESSAE